LKELPSVIDWMLAEGLESENIVFMQAWVIYSAMCCLFCY
jgi:hypothetical protein